MNLQACIDVHNKHIASSIALATAAAIISLANYENNGSVANASFLNAAHWVLVAVLFFVKFNGDLYVKKTDIEFTYFTYGILVGEVDSDSMITLSLVVVSMLCYRMHLRSRRQLLESAGTQDEAEIPLPSRDASDESI